MPKFTYIALDSRGQESKGVIDVASQNEAIGRVKEMGLFPTKIFETEKVKEKGGKKAKAAPGARKKKGGVNIEIKIPFLSGRVKPKVLTAFTRQLATLVDAGLPLLRGLRVLEKQERNRTLKTILSDLSLSIEGGSTFSEALAQHPKIFNRLFVNMVKAGELGGVLEVVLKRLAEFSEKAQKIKGKVKAAMFYPTAVLIVAMGILTLLMVFVIPRFRDVFNGMNMKLPGFTLAVLGVSEAIKNHAIKTVCIIAICIAIFLIIINKTKLGRLIWDKFKLK
ncbi:MAG: type II secretion system F family protein, partial [Limisphaerales bacterium]